MAQEKKVENFDSNVAAALSYLLSPFTGILFFAMEKEDKFVRFHAFQSILFGIVVMGAMSIATNLRFILIGFFLQPLFSMIAFAYWMILMWKAYNNEKYELPYLGKIAKEQIYKT